jgi:hypothetical protein
MANPFVHVELASTDIDKAKSFYQSLFDWQLKDEDMGGGMVYTMINVGERASIADHQGATITEVSGKQSTISAGELCLHTRAGLSLVKGLTEVGAVLQYRVERTARKWLAADQAWWKPRVFEPRVSPMSSSGAFTIP